MAIMPTLEPKDWANNPLDDEFESSIREQVNATQKNSWEKNITEKIAQANTTQVGGDHYKKLAIQPWDAMQSWMTPEQFEGFLRGNAIKYLARNKGNLLEDWQKAQHYLTKLIEVRNQSESFGRNRDTYIQPTNADTKY